MITSFDVGGSGVKRALFSRDPLVQLEPGAVLGVPDWENFELWLLAKLTSGVSAVGISTAGFVDADRGRVKLCRVAGWKDRDLCKALTQLRPGIEVFVINDAEAHGVAHHDLYPCPLLALSLGTSLGFSWIDARGYPIRPRHDSNFDIGAMLMATRASNKEVWWALGSHGLDELQRSMGPETGTRQFGCRLGSFLGMLAGIFQPRTIALSGGIIAQHGAVLREVMGPDFERALPSWCEAPCIELSPYGADAALWGIAKWIEFRERAK